MDSEKKSAQLQQDLDHVLTREHKAMEVLNQAAELVAFTPSLSKLESRDPIVSQIGAKAKSALAFASLGIFLFDEHDQDLKLHLSEPQSESQWLQKEMDKLIEQGAVALVLNQNRPAFFSVTNAPESQELEVVLHSIATPARLRGVFLGVMGQARNTLSDIQLPLLSIIMQQGAQMLESFELYYMHRTANLTLTENVRMLQAARRELAHAHEKLEEKVQERTKELANAIESLEEEVRERQRVQEKLHRRETTLRALFNATDNLIIMVDGQGCVLACNEATSKVYGLSVNDLRGKSPYELMPPHLAETAMSSLSKAIHLEKPIYHDQPQGDRQYSVKLYPVKGPDGEIMVAMFGQDVTEQRKAEKALRESESRYKSLFEDSPVSLWEEDCSEVRRYFNALHEQGVEDFEDYFARHPQEVPRCAAMVRILDVNKVTMKTYGARSKQQLLQSLDKLLLPEAMECLQEVFVTLAHGGLSYQGESMNKTLDGRTIDIQLQLHVAPDAAITLDKVLVSIVDVTEQKRMENALIQAKEDAERANKAKSNFLANMSHEMRTPLNGALGMAEVLLGMELQSEQREIVDTIQKNSLRLMHMVNDLLDLSHIDNKRFALESRTFSLCSSLETIASVFEKHCVKKGLAFAMNVDHSIPEKLEGDLGRFKQVLVNLLTNAVQYTQQGSVKACIALAAPVRPSPEDDSNVWLHCSVTDTGVGISKEHQQEIFDTFELGESYLTKRYSGAGLGLAIVRSIIEKMGGEIWVQSDPGEGSTFFFTVPFRLPEASTSTTGVTAPNRG